MCLKSDDNEDETPSREQSAAVSSTQGIPTRRRGARRSAANTAASQNKPSTRRSALSVVQRTSDQLSDESDSSYSPVPRRTKKQ